MPGLRDAGAGGADGGADAVLVSGVSGRIRGAGVTAEPGHHPFTLPARAIVGYLRQELRGVPRPR